MAQGAGHTHAGDDDSPALVWQITAAAAVVAVAARCCDNQRAPQRSLQDGLETLSAAVVISRQEHNLRRLLQRACAEDVCIYQRFGSPAVCMTA